MAENPAPSADSDPTLATSGVTLGSAAYEIIRQRLGNQADVLRERMDSLDARRQEVFGSIESKLLRADRVNTAHNCIPKDMVQIGGGRFLFGFNIRFGLKKEVELGDVFGVYLRDGESGMFREDSLALLEEKQFLSDFKRIYTVYQTTVFSKFSLIDGNLYMVFRTGANPGDIAVFKWATDGETLRYVDGRAEAEYRRIGFPEQYAFRWESPDRESYRYGDHPHVSIAERVFVECVGGSLTIKVEDNTKSGEGIYDEPVDDKRQKVDDADIAYAILGHIILIRIRPYKERAFRYLVFNEKSQSVVRVDSLGQSCALLPEDHGIIFPDGYYLGTGELKSFGSRAEDHTLERIIHAPNGEDSLFVFYSLESGEYVLLPYRLIAQKVDERITCHGFSLFPNGHLVLFRADNEPQKHHLIQLRQTPFYQTGFEPPGKREAFLYQVGNRDVVRCLAECNEVLTLTRNQNPYAELYADLVSRTNGILDGYPWLSNDEGFGVDEALRNLREAANQAVDEFDNVLRLQREAITQVAQVRAQIEEQFDQIRRANFQKLDDYVRNLAALRSLTGALITMRDVRYIDLAALDALGVEVSGETARISDASVGFLLKPEALDPYRENAAAQLAAVDKVSRVSDGKKIETEVAETSSGLELLIEIVNSLKIDDATETTRIIDGITAVYTTLNQVRGALRNRLSSLAEAEGSAQFAAQMKLLSQSAASYLDLCDTPAKCDEYLNRISVQIEELEGTFADFDETIAQIAERRTELYEAFEQRKIALVEARSKRTTALAAAADRILKAVENRLAGFQTIQEINTYLASDVMVARVRSTTEQLLELDDPIKADDLSTRLKGLGQQAVRQLKDRQELFSGGPGVIQLGRHAFNVNTQPLDLTIVQREGDQFIHLTGTRYFERIADPGFLATRAVWDQEFISENSDVYRAETLAQSLLKNFETDPKRSLADVQALSDDERLALVQEFMAGRYQEGYTRGIHDLDGAQIFSALLTTHLALGLARYRPAARALAVVYWLKFCPPEVRSHWDAKLRGFAERNRIFPGDPTQQGYIAELRTLLDTFVADAGAYPADLTAEAAEYLFLERTGDESSVGSREADDLVATFHQHLAVKGGENEFRTAVESLADFPLSQLEIIRDWLRGFLIERQTATAYFEEAAAIVFCGDALSRQVIAVETSRQLDGFKGSHARIDTGQYEFDYLTLRERLDRFARDVVPQFRHYHQLKQTIIDRERATMRLDEFRPRVLSSFVRNQLIDNVYLPLVGDNLAKQMGAAGNNVRTDRSGLLLLVSPPGYGKTTLLEYIASRLGIVFVKINGPALGYNTTSLDPEEAPNASAREEIQKLNLSLEMGDNVMICVDDIQHCSSEFLQKFISLCDAQRKIEGVWRGQPRTYDLRGRKVVVVMAGNPYTETGQKFRIPDMLSNRADTYNLGDIIGSSAEWFKASYIENSVTSNPVLAPLANRSQSDIRKFLRMAETDDRDTSGFEGSYSSREVEETISVLKKLISIREVILAVNLEYIRSAAQAEEFRTEPAFKLQGSYRNMNRLAERIVAIMNDAEVQALILDHYRNESQTLTADTEANLLKLRELLDILTPEEALRWAEIKRTFQRNLLTHGGDDNDPISRVVGQLSAFGVGLESIQRTLADGLKASATDASSAVSDDISSRMRSVTHELEMIHATLASLRDMARKQRDYLQGAREELASRAKQGVIEFELTDEMLENEKQFLDRFQELMADREGASSPSPEEMPPPPGQ